MADIHVDLVNGNDANDGSSWALARKTIPTTGTDTIKVAKSADPVSLGINATWTDETNTVVLDSPLTKTIDLAVGNTWTMGASVTGTTYTYRKTGASSQQFTLAAEATGKIGFKTLAGAIDFSAYSKISLFVSGSHVANYNARNFRICLCSDTTGDTIVDTLPLGSISVINVLHILTVDKGSSLGSSINSVAVYCDAGLAVNMRINALIACNDFSLLSLISKTNTIGSEWYPIACIDGVNVTIDNGNFANTLEGYSGVTENVLTYRRETIVASISIATARVVKFGWNTATDEQDSETWIEGTNGNGTGIASTALSAIENVGAVRFATGLSFSRFDYIKNVTVIGCLTKAFTLHARWEELGTIENLMVLNNTGTSDMQCNGIQGLTCMNNYHASSQTAIISYSSGIYMKDLKFINNHQIGLSLRERPSVTNAYIISVPNDNIIENLTIAKHGTFGLMDGGTNNIFINFTLNNDKYAGGYNSKYYNSDILPIGANQYPGDGACEYNRDRVPGAFKQSFLRTFAEWQTAVKQGNDPGAWNIYTTSYASYVMTYTTVAIRLAEIAVEAGVQITVRAWVRGASGLSEQARLIIRRVTSPVVESDYFTNIQEGATWREVGITFTPTSTGVVVLEFQAAQGNYYVGSISLTT